MTTLVSLLLLAQTSTTATLAATATTSTTTPGLYDAVELAGRAFYDRNWLLLASAVLTLLVIGFRFFDFGKKLPPEVVPWVTLGLAMATSVAVGLQTSQRFTTILSTGFIVGLAAIGGWESFAKMIRALLRKLRGSPGAPADKLPPAGD